MLYQSGTFYFAEEELLTLRYSFLFSLTPSSFGRTIRPNRLSEEQVSPPGVHTPETTVPDPGLVPNPSAKKLNVLTALGPYGTYEPFMDALPSYRQCAIAALPFSRRRHRLGHRCACLGLIGVLGVLAFLFSALSPGDDDIQQEFFSRQQGEAICSCYLQVRAQCPGLPN